VRDSIPLPPPKWEGGGVGSLHEFCILHCEHVPLQRRILLLVRKRLRISGFLLSGQRFHSRTCLAEFLTHCQLLSGIRLLLQVARLTDATGAQGFASFLEIRVRVLTDFTTVLFYHVDRFVLCHFDLGLVG